MPHNLPIKTIRCILQSVVIDYNRCCALRTMIVGLNGTAGSANSTAAGILKELAESQGYAVKGLAPIRKAAHSPKKRGISSDTLQSRIVENSCGALTEPGRSGPSTHY